MGVGRLMSQVRFSGMRLTLEFSALSHVTALPVYADIRPMIAVSVLSATCFNSLSGLLERMRGFADQCMAEYDLEGWTSPDLITPHDVNLFLKKRT